MGAHAIKLIYGIAGMTSPKQDELDKLYEQIETVRDQRNYTAHNTNSGVRKLAIEEIVQIVCGEQRPDLVSFYHVFQKAKVTFPDDLADLPRQLEVV